MRRTERTFYASIWMAGDYAQAVQACQTFCLEVPLCVTVTPTTYVYTGGVEAGVCVRLIRYPKFPDSSASIADKARGLAEYLRGALRQQSYTIEHPDLTHWDTHRGDSSAEAFNG